jgi:ubiquinone/menaquinone biosynthesis C-methylase UbiE
MPNPSRLGIAGRIRHAAASLLSTLLRFAFHLLYHQLAFTYDAVAWIVSGGEWAEWRRCVLPYLVPGPILEIAHGTGTLALDMSEHGYAVTAIDLSPAMGKIMRGKKKRRQRNAIGKPPGPALPQPGRSGDSVDNPSLVQADVQRLPFQSGFFSSAVATFPADFIFFEQTLREVHRALRPGGRWIILPTAFPEWLAKRWLPDDATISTGAVWHATVERLEAYGFRVRMEIVRRSRSRVLLILADKF